MLRPIGGLNEYQYIISDITVTVKDSKDNLIILANNIVSFNINHDYLLDKAPLFQMTAGVEKNLYTLLTSREQDISMQITIHKYIKNSDIQAKELVMSRVFSILNENEMQPNETKILYGDEDNVTDNTISGSNTQQLVEASFYLIDRVKLENEKKISSLALNNATITDAIAALYSMRGFKDLLMNKVPGDARQNIVIPTHNLAGSLYYLNSKYGIFNTDYIFYMDFKDNYLLDKSALGKAIRNKAPFSVNMYLEETSSVESADVGSYLHNDAFIINLTQPPLVQKLDNYGELIDGTNITGVNPSGTVSKVDGEKGSMARTVWAFNDKVLKQIQYRSKEARYTVGVNLINVDIDSIAPNLLYTIIAHSKYQSINPINGKYRLNEANLSFAKIADGEFTLKCSTIFMKVQ